MASNHPQATSQSQGEGPYILAIGGLPGGYTWQDLKDTVRPKASHGIWAYMQPTSREADRGSGWVKVQRLNEARDLYYWLINDGPGTPGTQKDRRLCGLAVCLYDIYGRLKESNCGGGNETHRVQSALQAVPHWHYFTPDTTLTPSIPQNGNFYAPAPHTSHPANLARAMAGMNINASEAQTQQFLQAREDALRQRYIAQYASHQYVPPAVYAQSSAATSSQQSTSPVVFAQSASGAPINISAGYVSTEQCGVFVHGLNFKARTHHVKELFSKAGRVVDCNVVKDSTTGKSKGYATVLFESRRQAQRAIEEFDGRNFMGRSLEVRIDKESTKILGSQLESSSSRSRSTTDPLVVNGSGSSRHGSG